MIRRPNGAGQTGGARSEAGNGLFWVFIFASLLGFLFLTFTHGSRSNMAWLKDEEGRATVVASATCTTETAAAVKRLESRGCGSSISYATDGSNTLPGAPTDGSCSIYHPNGGGIRYCP